MINDDDLNKALRTYARISRLEREHARTTKTLEDATGKRWRPMTEDEPAYKKLERKADRLYKLHANAIKQLRTLGGS